MRRRTMIVSLVIVIGWTVQGSSAQAPTAVEGSWLVTSLSSGGTTHNSSEFEMVLTFVGSSYEQTVHGQITEQGRFRINSETKPMAIDFMVGEGSVQKQQLGIAEVSDDALKLHLNQFGADARPADFNLLPDHVLIVARRIR